MSRARELEPTFLGVVIGICVTRMYYEGVPAWWIWVLSFLVLVLVLGIVRWWRRRG